MEYINTKSEEIKDLRSCPFCGGYATIVVDNMGVKIECIGCGIQTAHEIDNEKKRGAIYNVIDKWNKRTAQ